MNTVSADNGECDVGCNPAPTFVITQVQYTDPAQKNNPQTAMFDAKTGMAQIPAVAVKGQLIFGGTYTPANTMLAGTVNVYPPKGVVGGGNASGVPTLKDGNWTLTVAANIFRTNQNFTVYTNYTGGAKDTVKIKNTIVDVVEKTLTISAN